MKMMFRNLVILLCCVGASWGLASEFSLDKKWEDFKRVHKKMYSKQEESRRKSIWLKNVHMVTNHNNETDNGHRSFRLEINKFADMTSQEVRCISMPHILEKRNTINVSILNPPNNLQIPDTVDWRIEGYVTRVKNQGQCGSCWAFSTTGGLEGQHFKKTGKLVSLSEQNLVDCNKENDGCNGGRRSKAYQYIVKNGINTEDSYPYVGQKRTCTFRRSHVGATCTGFSQVPAGDELALQKAVASVGPISVGIRVDDAFLMYKEGVYDSQNCQNTNSFHAVLIVGYGVFNGKDYWLVKNSWSTNWGMKGYIMMSRNQNNQCGIADSAMYPIVGDMPSSDCSYTLSSLPFVSFLFFVYHIIGRILI